MDLQNATRITTIRKVSLEDVNTNAKPYPKALGRDNAGSQFEIDLTQIPTGLYHVPKQGEVWWIEHRTSRWTLLKLANDESVVGKPPGAEWGPQLEQHDMRAVWWMDKL